LLLAHLDVVPVDPATEAKWTHPPFAGAVADGFVWGRGALDDKAALVTQLEAVEHLLAAGFVPRRTVIFAFGHDEEVGGRGARALCARLQARGDRIESVLDEGTLVLSGTVPGIARPVALIGAGEKGYLSVALTTRAPGGHSSMPPPHTAVGELARAITRLEDHPPPARLIPAVREMFLSLAREGPFLLRLVMGSLWLTEPLLLRQLAGRPATNALVRTTTAVTMIEGGPKENVLPEAARAVVNFRVLPGETSETVRSHARARVGDAVEVKLLEATLSEPSPVSPLDGPVYARLQRAVRQIFPEAIVAPTLVLGATDARHYTALTPAVYRFMPFPITSEDLRRFHGTDERIAVATLPLAVRFYAQWIRLGSE
jgi:carboxypeptidase PM20D1